MPVHIFSPKLNCNNKLVNWLPQTYTCIIVAILQNCDASVVVGVDAELLYSSADDSAQFEERIVLRSRDLLSSTAKDRIRSELDEFDELLRRFGLQTRLVVLERTNSIELLFVCLTVSAVTSLRDQWRSGQLRESVKCIFAFLLNFETTIHLLRLKWPLVNYERCLKFFSFSRGMLCNHKFQEA